MKGLFGDRQSGSVTVLIAAMSLILVAFVGLSVDGGEIETQQRESQNAADASALAAATAVINADNYGYSITDAQNIGLSVTSYNGIPQGDVTFSFKDSTGSATTDPTKVATVTSTVTHLFSTLFLPVMGINTATVSATATVSITQVAGSDCGLCSLASSGTAINVQSGGQINVSGGNVRADSNGSPAISTDNGAATKITASAIYAVGSATGNLSPAAQTGAAYAFSDPLTGIPTPALGLTATAVTYSSNTTISPGTYGAVNIPSGVTVTMRPGVYVFAGALTLNGTLNGSSVMLYFACASGGVSAACSSGQSGGDVNINGSATISAPAAGSDYTGLVFFADRNDTANLNLAGTWAPTGTIYGASMTMNINHGSHQSLTSRVVVGQVVVNNGGILTITYTASGNYVAPGKLKMTA